MFFDLPSLACSRLKMHALATFRECMGPMTSFKAFWI